MEGVSLITICWNAGKTIRRTLESVLGQSLLPCEYVIVDGGSEDGTLGILEEFRPRFESRGVLFRVEPQRRVPGEAGIPNAWNQVLRGVRGDVVGMLNADDWYDSEALSQVWEAFRNDAALGAVSVPVRMLHEEPSQSWTFFPRPLSLLPWKMPVPHPGTFFRRSTYDAVGLYDTRYRIAADYDFVWRCRGAGIRWRYLDVPCVNMQLGGLANASRRLARCETCRIARSHSAFFDLRPYLAWLLRLMTGR